MRCYLALLLHLFLFSANCNAQQQKDPDNFFGDHFAARTFEKEAQRAEQLRREEVLAVREEFATRDVRIESIPIEKVHMLTDGDDSAHLFSSIQEFTKTFLTRNLKPGTVFISGLIYLRPTDAPQDWIKIISHGGRIQADYQLMQELGLSRSPSWILETKQGRIVLEGFDSIDRFLTEDGRFHARYLEEGKDNASET